MNVLLNDTNICLLSHDFNGYRGESKRYYDLYSYTTHIFTICVVDNSNEFFDYGYISRVCDVSALTKTTKKHIKKALEIIQQDATLNKSIPPNRLEKERIYRIVTSATSSYTTI